MRKAAAITVLVILLLVVVRQAYPYFSGNDPTVVEGYEVTKVASDLGGPTCLVWMDDTHLLVCDRDEGAVVELNIDTDQRRTLLSNLDRPHGLALDENNVYVSEAGQLSRYDINTDGLYVNGTVLVQGVPVGNHQTNAVSMLPNGTLLWHSGSTCNICDEDDSRNGALLWVNATTGAHGVLASGVRNSFDGVWVDGHGYFFTDNGRDWEGDHPQEELNFLVEGAAYGWPDDDPDHPVPSGTQAPVGGWTPHTSMNGIDVRPSTSSLPGLNEEEGFTLYATVYGSWNTVLPEGHEILRIDVRINADDGTYNAEFTRFAWDAGTPLPLVFHPNGELYYATFGNNGSLFSISEA